jgi:GT2 family glycosyltransferase
MVELKQSRVKKIDVVIISDAKNQYCRILTEKAIESARLDSCIGEVIVIEKQDCDYEGAKVFRQVGEFCYNRFLNEGAGYGKSEYIAFCNNDLLFEKNWASIIIDEMEMEWVSSASPFSPISNFSNRTFIEQNSGNHFGYEIRKHFCGWCFVWKRELWDKIKHDERINFWTSDDATAHQLKENDEKHILVTNSIVHHVNNGSVTLNTLPNEDKSILMHDEVKKFNRLYNKNLFDLGKDIEGRVSVVVPVFGDMDYWKPFLERSTKSALNQTVKAHNVVINVGKDLHEARNSFLKRVKSEFIIFLDADDELDEKYIEEMLKIEDADIIVPSVHRYYQDGRIDTNQYLYAPRPLITGNHIVIGCLLRVSLLKKIGGFDNLPLYEDWSTWLKMEESDAVFKQCPNAIYKIHVREGSRNEPSVEMKIMMFNKIQNDAKKRRGLI